MQNKKVIILLGPPGAGKGTISCLLEKKLDWKKLVTGNLCRKHIYEQTDLGLKIQRFIEQGQLVPDSIIMDMIEQWLQQNKNGFEGFIFDGMPRTLNQAHFVQKMLKEKFTDFAPIVIQLQAKKKSVLERILSRLICSNNSCQSVYSLLDNSKMKPKNNMVCNVCDEKLIKRFDDTQKTLEKRLDDYYQYEKDMVDYYKEQNIAVHTIDANKSIDEVFETIQKIANA